LKIVEKHWSEAVSKLSTWLSGQVSFEEAAVILEQVGGIHLSGSTAWRTAQHWGETMRILEEAQSQAAQQKPVESTQPVSEERLGAALDGAIIYIRGEGWKELKVGCIFEIMPNSLWDEHIGEAVQVGQAVHNSYVAHLGPPQPFGNKLFAEARRRNWLHVSDTQVLGDGASWIWNLAEEHFAGSHQTVDWYHAKQHLFAACYCFHAEGTPAAQRWMNAQTELLFQGHAERIAQDLHQAAEQQPDADQEAGYFESNHRRMNYMELREEGWLIGSGMIESGAKQFKVRFAGPGMRWSRNGAERLLPIRAAVMGHQFDRIWKAVYNPPQN
jgi:hypothetical protein